MAGWLDRILGRRSRVLGLARKAELLGDLDRAAALFERAGEEGEARRVRRSRARATLASSDAASPATGRRRIELAQAGADFEATGEYRKAAEAYRRAGDVEGQARALAQAGEIERVDALLEGHHAREHDARARRQAHDEFEMFVASGQRQRAAEFARASSDASLRDRGRRLQARRVCGPVVDITLRATKVSVVLGDRVVIGRAPELDGPDPGAGAIVVASAAVSRRHLSIARRNGEIVISDLGSHNGTILGATPIIGDLLAGDGVELHLGQHVPLVVQPADDLPGAAAIEVGGRRYLAPLGQAMLGIGRWSLERAVPSDGADAWVELVTEMDPPAYSNGLRLVDRVALIEGDAISMERIGAAVMIVARRGS